MSSNDITKYVQVIVHDPAVIDNKHGATRELSKMLPDGYLGGCVTIYRMLQEYADHFRSGHDGGAGEQLKTIWGAMKALPTMMLTHEQKRLHMHKIIMEMNITPHLRIQYLVALWGAVDKRRDIALDALLLLIVTALEQSGHKPSWKLVADFMAEQGLLPDDETENMGEALRLRHARAIKKHHVKDILDTLLHMEVGEGGASSTSI